MTIEKYEYLPGIVSEIQDGGLAIVETNTAPSVLIMGTASKGISEVPVQVTRSQEIEMKFGLGGTLVKNMYECLSGGARNVYVMRIGATSAILYGVGTDNQATNPTSIETLIKDKDAADVYFIQYKKPATLGPNALVGHLIVKNALGTIVYDNNPGGQVIDSGEVIVSGDFTGGEDIGLSGFVSMRNVAKDGLSVTKENTAIAYDKTTGVTVDVLKKPMVAGNVIAYIGGQEVPSANVVVDIAGNQIQIKPGMDLVGDVLVSYEYDGEPKYTLRDGIDGDKMSKMELYEAIERGFRVIENEEFKIIIIGNTHLDDKNVADGDIAVLSTDARTPVGRRYPVPGSKNDVLGKVFVEEYEGEFFYFWDINGDGKAEIYPKIGLASASKNIAGEDFTVQSFKEVNFAYQLANFCFVSSGNEYNVSGVIACNMPKSFSAKELSLWVGKEPEFDEDGAVLKNGSGLLGNKFLAGRTDFSAGFWATSSGFLPVGGEKDADVLVDRGGQSIDIGRYISVFPGVQTFYNNLDTTGYGYHSPGAAFYAGYYSTLAPQSAPTNKVAEKAEVPFKLSQTKLNLLAKYSMIAYKEKNGVLRFSDAPTAARPDSDFRRLTTVRVVADVIDRLRRISEPYIGGPNTKNSRASLELNGNKELAKVQEIQEIQQGSVRVLATQAQEIKGSAEMELSLTPPFELRKIYIITTLAKA